MASLVDIARAMDKEKALQEQKQSVKLAAVAPSTPGLSLVDIARDQQVAKTATAKPLSLVDVARKADTASGNSSNAAASPVSLQSLAQEINAEERARIDTAITKAATDAKQEKINERANILKAAASEVLRKEETQETTIPRKQSSVEKPSFIDRPPLKAPPSPVLVVEQDSHGYSSFEEDEPEMKPKESVPAKKMKAAKIVDEDEDNQSASGSDTGPEKTTPSDSPLTKQFLRAIYRGDTRRVRDMLRDEDVDASSADQHGWSALHWAASQAQSEILSILLENNARVNAVEHVNGWTSLHLAVMRDAVACAKKLLHAGAKINIYDLYGDTAHDLLKAVKGKRKERWLQLFLAARRH